MKTSDFEERLQCQPFTEPPAAWREAIIDAAAAALPRSTVEQARFRAPWWTAWLRPARLGWIGLGAAWMLIFVLNHAARPEPLPSALTDGRPAEVWSTWESHQRVLARQLDDAPAPERIPPPPGPERQSALRMMLPLA